MKEWIELDGYSLHIDEDGYIRRGLKEHDTQPCRVYRLCRGGDGYDAVALKPAYLKRLYKAGKIIIR